ncbi:hypothetical protein VNO80_06493 [Phaseolus coccineus]|uniref:Peptidase S8/S53 domain-containing protein n=1 Tax=Phaseolus coccineus TaxID=3886 RepID=A0AAN9NHL7_PHACN
MRHSVDHLATAVDQAEPGAAEQDDSENFALMSGTIMVAPHVAGLVALIKQKFPNFIPAAIGSVLSTSASLYDNNGRSILAQRSNPTVDLNLSLATPFDMGSGFVNATTTVNPGLLFDSIFHSIFMDSTPPSSKRIKTRAVRRGGRLEAWFSGEDEKIEKSWKKK